MAGRGSRGHSASPLLWAAKETGRSETPHGQSSSASVRATNGRKRPPSAFPVLWEEICEQGFAKSIGRIGVDLREETQACRVEVSQATEALRAEFSDLKQLAPAMAEIMERLDQQEERERARVIDFSPVRLEIQESGDRCLHAYRELVEGLEGRLLAKVERRQQETEAFFMARVREELSQARESGEEVEHYRVRTERLFETMLETQRALAVQCADASKGLKELQEENRRLEDKLGAQLLKHFREHRVSVDFSKVDHHISQVSHVQIANTKTIMTELAKIQQALNVDFASIIDDVTLQVKSIRSEGVAHAVDDDGKTDESKGEESKGENEGRLLVKKRMRQFWTQTDAQETEDIGTQTDPSLLKDKKKKKWLPDRKGEANKSSVSLAAKVKPVFADRDAMKLKKREAMIKKQYNVMDHYHTIGLPQRIARSALFEQLTLVVITLNAIWIAVDTDYNHATVLTDAHPVFQIAENGFCLYFSAELLIRFLAFNGKRYCLRDAWFVFDVVLVALMVVETWVITLIMMIASPGGSAGLGNASILRMVRMVRMLRVSRMARLLRTIPELVILIKGIGVASRSVLIFFALWLVIIYVFGVFFRQVTDGQDIGLRYFETVPEAMNTLLLDGLLPDNSPIVNQVAESNPILWPVIMFYIGLAGVTIMYMLIGVLVDVVASIATIEKEGMVVAHVAQQLREAIEKAGRDLETPITKFEFETLLGEADVSSVIQGVGVDVVVLADMMDVIYDDAEKIAKGLSFEQFVDIVLNMRGSNHATVKDVKEQLRVVKKLMWDSQAAGVEKLKAEITKLRDEMWELHAAAMQEREREESGGLGGDVSSSDDD